jgi:signal recognition particle GTPase
VSPLSTPPALLPPAEKLFIQQMEYMTASPTYTMGDHIKLYETIAEKAGLKGWRTMLLTVAQKAELAEQVVDLKIGAALTDAERANPKVIDARGKARIAVGVGCDLERVNRFLDNFQQSATIHTWLRGRSERGQAIPTNMTDFVHCMMADRVHFRSAGQKDRTQRGPRPTPGQTRSAMRRL